jgi:hypothetical protein
MNECSICFEGKETFTVCCNNEICHSCFLSIKGIETFKCPYCRHSSKLDHINITRCELHCTTCNSNVVDWCFKQCPNGCSGPLATRNVILPVDLGPKTVKRWHNNIVILNSAIFLSLGCGVTEPVGVLRLQDNGELHYYNRFKKCFISWYRNAPKWSFRAITC